MAYRDWEKYGVSSDETGVDLVELILTTELEKVKGKGDEDITAHPEYLKLKNERFLRKLLTGFPGLFKSVMKCYPTSIAIRLLRWFNFLFYS